MKTKERADTWVGEPKRRLGVEKWLPLIVVVGVVVAYAQSLSAPFIYDDHLSVIWNRNIRQLWPLTASMSAPPQTPTAGRPVVCLTFALNHALGGMKVTGYRAFNLTTHVLCSLLLVGIIRRALLSPPFYGRFENTAGWVAAAAAAIWAIHPLQTDAVTYVTQRTELLMALFYLSTLYCSIRAWSSPRPRRWLAAAIVSCALGMGSKEVMVSGPLIVMLYDRTFAAGAFRSVWRRRWGFYLSLGVTWIILAALIVQGPRSKSIGFGHGITALEYLATQVGVIVHYLRLSLWPDPLVISYDDWPVARSFIETWPYGLVVAVLLGGTLWGLGRRHWSGFFGAWFFMILAPTSSFVPVVNEVAAERRMYLPLAAVVVLIVMVIRWIATSALSRLSRRSAAPQLTAAGVVIVLVVSLGYGTVERNKAYQTRVAIWEDVVSKRPNNAVGHHNLGMAYFQEKRLDEAIDEYRRALRIEPRDFQVHYNMGLACSAKGDLDQAIKQFSEVIRLKPDSADAYSRLGTALADKGQYEAAVSRFREAIRIKPNYVDVHFNLGGALLELGRLGAAIEAFQEVLRLSPGFYPAHENLGTCHLALGQLDEAVKHFRAAVSINPEQANAHANLGIALRRKGEIDEAIKEYREALAIDPNHVFAHNNLATALRRQGRLDEAVAEYREVVRLDPGLADAHYSLASALLAQGRIEEAIESYRTALQLNPGDVQAREELRQALESRRVGH